MTNSQTLPRLQIEKHREVEVDREKEFQKCVFQMFSKLKKIYHFSRHFDERPSIAQRTNETRRKLLENQYFTK